VLTLPVAEDHAPEPSALRHKATLVRLVMVAQPEAARYHDLMRALAGKDLHDYSPETVQVFHNDAAQAGVGL